MRQMTERIATMLRYGIAIVADGLRRYLPRISAGWWMFVVIVFLLAAIHYYKAYSQGKKTILYALGSLVIVGYLLSVFVITFGTRLPDPHIQYQLIPFLSHRLALQGDANEQFQLLCNVLLFVPFGVLYPIIIIEKRKDTSIGILCAAFSFSFSIEIMQLITRYGCFEIDDMINNVLGAVIGYLLVSVFRRIYRLCLKMFAGKKTEN